MMIVQKMLPLKYLNNFWRTLVMSLINCETNLTLTWFDICVLSNDSNAPTFAIIDTKLYVPIVTLTTQDNAKLLDNYDHVLNEQLIGTNINQTFHQKDKINI